MWLNNVTEEFSVSKGADDEISVDQNAAKTPVNNELTSSEQ